MDLLSGLELDAALRFVDEIRRFPVDRYAELDGRLGWQPVDGLELSLVGQNLLHAHHPEYQGGAIPFIATQVERGLHASLSWSF